MNEDLENAAIEAMREYFARHLKMIERWREETAKQEVDAFLASLKEREG